MGYLRMLGMTNKQKKIINFFLYFQYISFDQTFHFFNNNSLTKSSLRVQKFINWPKKGISQGNIGKKNFNSFFENFSNFLKKSQGSPYEIFWLKVTLDIKMSNPWLYLNHQYMVKYCVFMPFLAVQKSPFRVRTPCIYLTVYHGKAVLNLIIY